MSKATELLHRAAKGDKAAIDELFPIVKSQLRSRANRKIRVMGIAGLVQTTQIVSDVFGKLLVEYDYDFPSQRAFYSVASKAMYWLMIDAIRDANRIVKLDTDIPGNFPSARNDPLDALVRAEEFQLLISAMVVLEQADPERHEIVMLRIFGGQTVAEVATLLGCSEKKVSRDWRGSLAFLKARMCRGTGSI